MISLLATVSAAAAAAILALVLLSRSATVRQCVYRLNHWYVHRYKNGVYLNGRKLEAYTEPQPIFGTSLKQMNDPSGQLEEILKNAKKNGGFYLGYVFGDPVVGVTNRKYANEVLGMKFTMKNSTRDLGSLVPVFGLMFRKHIGLVGSDEWKRYHKLWMRGIGSKHHQRIFKCILESAQQVIASFDEAMPKEGAAVRDMDVTVTGFTLKSVMKLALGQNAVNEETKEIAKLVLQVFRQGTSPLYMMNAFLSLPLEGPSRLHRNIAGMRDFTRNYIEKYRAEMKSGKKQTEDCFLKAMVTDGEDGYEFSDEECIDNVLGMVTAASDTTSASIMHTLIMLATHHDVQERARDEIRTFLATNATEELTDVKVLDGLPYLSAAIKETLRLFPTVHNSIFRTTTKQVQLGPLTIPKGCNVHVPPFVTNRDPELWGDDADQFNPDRFLKGETKGTVNLMDTCDGAFNTFGGGFRSCIGKRLASQALKVFLMLLLQKFRFELLPDHKTSKHWKTTIGLTIPKKEREQLRVSRLTPATGHRSA